MQTTDSNSKVGFGSDNHSGALPEVISAIAKCNVGHQPSYGTDRITRTTEKMILENLGCSTGEVHFVFNGTAANVLAVDCLVESHHSVLVADCSHLYVDECAAPEKHIGCKLIPVPSINGKLSPELLKPFVIRRGDQHFAQVKAVSITQPTEFGTVYSLKELEELRKFAKENKLLLHLDGARLFNAAAALNCSLKDIVEGFDVVALGGTKNGLVFGEAVVILNAELTKDFKYRRKQAMQLPSKTRFIAAQFEALFENGLWSKTANHVNQLAKDLESKLRALEYVKITRPVQANAVFAILPREIINELREKYFFYVWDENTFEVRLMATFDTTAEQVSGFVAEIQRLMDSKKNKP